jgi:hypothetical protein
VGCVTEVEHELEEIGKRLSTKVLIPMSQGYQPEVDTTSTPELDAMRAYYFQGLMGALRWICEQLGRIDILVDVAMLSCFLASPRPGHAS